MRARSSNWIEQGTPKPKVASSILAGRTILSATVPLSGEPHRVFARYAFSIVATAGLLAGCGSQLPMGASRATYDTGDALPKQETFYYTGAEQTFRVPSGVTSIDVDIRGAAGAGYSSTYGGGGRGGRVMATIVVYPGRLLYVFVGGEGSNDKGGFNGGGNGGTDSAFCDYGWGGGGASDVREKGDALADRILVAGGGGGGAFFYYDGYASKGGSGGGKTGGDGTSLPSGGGGGGGGGPLGAAAGGGGGSGYAESTAIKSRMWRGWKTATGNGVVVFSWQ